MNIKDREYEKPAEKNPYCNKQKIHESNGNVLFLISFLAYDFAKIL